MFKVQPARESNETILQVRFSRECGEGLEILEKEKGNRG